MFIVPTGLPNHHVPANVLDATINLRNGGLAPA